MSGTGDVLGTIVEKVYEHGVHVTPADALARHTPGDLQERWERHIRDRREADLPRLENGHETRLFAWRPPGEEVVSFVWMDLGSPKDDEGDWRALGALTSWDPRPATRRSSA